MTDRYASLSLFIVLLANAADAQVVRDSTGTTEFIGLSTWSPQRLLDTLRMLAPGQAIHQCAVTLKGQLGFPEASVMYFPDRRVTLVTVLEPRDSARVRYNPRPTAALELPKNWAPLAAAADSQPQSLELALLSWRFHQTGRPDSAATFLARFGSSLDRVEPLWVALSTGTETQALQLLEQDSNPVHRQVAAAALIRFTDDPGAWRAIVRALRDPAEGVGIVASQVLEQLTNYSPRPIDWGADVESVRAILDGTRLFFLPTLIRALNVTGVEPVLAPRLLRNGGQLLLAYATAEEAPVREDARALLRRLTQTDAGPGGDEWRAWIAAPSRP